MSTFGEDGGMGATLLPHARSEFAQRYVTMTWARRLKPVFNIDVEPAGPAFAGLFDCLVVIDRGRWN